MSNIKELEPERWVYRKGYVNYTQARKRGFIRHRADGPSILEPNRLDYYINGIFIHFEEV